MFEIEIIGNYCCDIELNLTMSNGKKNNIKTFSLSLRLRFGCFGWNLV